MTQASPDRSPLDKVLVLDCSVSQAHPRPIGYLPLHHSHLTSGSVHLNSRRALTSAFEASFSLALTFDSSFSSFLLLLSAPSLPPYLPLPYNYSGPASTPAIFYACIQARSHEAQLHLSSIYRPLASNKLPVTANSYRKPWPKRGFPHVV